MLLADGSAQGTAFFPEIPGDRQAGTPLLLMLLSFLLLLLQIYKHLLLEPLCIPIPV